MMIFVFFKPLEIKKQEFKNVPLLNIDKFTMYEFDVKGLQTVMSGKRALRFSDRYTVNDINFTDYSKEFNSNMKAKRGLYKGDIVDLKGDVRYHREDGLAFKSPTLVYNTKTAIATTNDDYIANFGVNTMIGKSLIYNSKLNRIKSTDVLIKYKLNEKKK
jgi:LPS export ABC transporter protein LptC